MADVRYTEIVDEHLSGRYRTAQACATFGWCVLPFTVVNGQKRPKLKGWPTRATTDLETIEQWWGFEGQGFYGCEVGIATGSCSGIWVLDIDRHGHIDGFRMLAELEARYGAFPRTFTVRTPSGGEHRYFAYPEDGREIWTKAGTLGPGLDTRGWHGFVGAPDSQNARGRYEITDFTAPVPAPRWVEDMAERKRDAKEPPKVQLTDRPSDFYGWVSEASTVTGKQEWYLFTGLSRMQEAGLPDEVMRTLARAAVAKFPTTTPEWPWSPEDADDKVRHVSEIYVKGGRR